MCKCLNIQYRTVERCGAKAIILDSLINKLRWKPFGPKWPTISYIITDSTWKIFGDKDSDGKGAGNDYILMLLIHSDVKLVIQDGVCSRNPSN